MGDREREREKKKQQKRKRKKPQGKSEDHTTGKRIQNSRESYTARLPSFDTMPNMLGAADTVRPTKSTVTLEGTHPRFFYSSKKQENRKIIRRVYPVRSASPEITFYSRTPKKPVGTRDDEVPHCERQYKRMSDTCSVCKTTHLGDIILPLFLFTWILSFFPFPKAPL